MAIETYFDKRQMKCEKIIKRCDKLRNESDKLYEEAEEHLSNANELEWEDCLKSAIEKESFASGIEYVLKELGFMN